MVLTTRTFLQLDTPAEINKIKDDLNDLFNSIQQIITEGKYKNINVILEKQQALLDLVQSNKRAQRCKNESNWLDNGLRLFAQRVDAWELLDHVSKDAQTMVDLLFQAPGDIARVVGATRPVRTRKAIFAHLSNVLGSNDSQIKNALAEVQTCLA